MAEKIEEQVEVFKENVAKKNVDVVILFQSEQNLEKAISKIIEADTQTGSFMGMLFIPITFKKRIDLVISPLEEIETREDIYVTKFSKSTDLFKPLPRKRKATVGLNYANITLLQSKWLKKEIKKIIKEVTFKDISKEIAMLRREKTDFEIKQITKAIDITERIFSKTINYIPSCKKEIDVVTFLKMETIKEGCTLAFEPIVASGSNASKIHYHSNQKEILQKGFCVIDFGVRYKGYHADITRTIYIGKPSKKEKELYSLVKETQEKVIFSSKKEDNYETVFNLAKKIGSFTLCHALGHGIGLEIHEHPHIGPSLQKIKERDVIAIEPGIYISEKESPTKKPFGIRIEDDFIVTKKGFERLSKSSRELITVTKK